MIQRRGLFTNSLLHFQKSQKGFPMTTSLNLSLIERRGSPNLHRAFGQRWPAVLEAGGSHYLGDTLTRKSVRTPTHRPERVLAINSDGQPHIWRNRCLHQSRILVKPAENGLPIIVPDKEPIRCDWHSSTYDYRDGTLLRPGVMPIAVSRLPEGRCRDFEKHVWQDRIVFELGRNTEACDEKLRRTLRFVDEVAGDLFDFRHYQLRRTLVSPQQADLLMTFINYLDIRHVANHRKTLGRLVDLKSYTHAAQPDGLAVFQRMGLNPSWLKSRERLATLLRSTGIANAIPNCGAAWVTTADGLMLEWYPGVIVVSVGLPDPNDPWKCVLHHDFYYHHLASDAFIAAHQKLFYDTGIEDEVWCHDGTTFCQQEIAEGRGDDSWGFADPTQENYAGWLYGIAEAARETT